MKEELKAFNIKFVSLPLGENEFDYQLDNSFFEVFDYREFSQVNLKVDLRLFKKNTGMELFFKIKGTVGLACDLTQMPFEHPLSTNTELLVKFGEAYDDTNDEVLILPQGEHTLNIAQIIYESVVLAVPLKRVHPDVESGKVKPEIYGFKNLITEENIEEENEETQQSDDKTDPRWDKLKDLLN